MGLLLTLIVRSIVGPLQETVNAMANIASGESDLTRTLDTHGQDEVTQLARHFNAFTRQAAASGDPTASFGQCAGAIFQRIGQRRGAGSGTQPAAVATNGTGSDRDQ